MKHVTIFYHAETRNQSARFIAMFPLGIGIMHFERGTDWEPSRVVGLKRKLSASVAGYEYVDIRIIPIKVSVKQFDEIASRI